MKGLCLVITACALVAVPAGCQQTGGGGGTGGGTGGGLGGTLPNYGPSTSTVSFGTLPASPGAFDAVWNGTAKDPEGAAACFVLAALLLERNPALGEQCMLRVASPDGYNIRNGKPGNSFKELVRRMKEQPWIARSYVQGATPANGYAVSPPYRIVFDGSAGSPRGRPGGNKAKVFVVCAGADSARPVTVSAEAEGYRIYEASSISVGIRPPAR